LKIILLVHQNNLADLKNNDNIANNIVTNLIL